VALKADLDDLEKEKSFAPLGMWTPTRPARSPPSVLIFEKRKHARKFAVKEIQQYVFKLTRNSTAKA
jgi:hypothetical protein